MNFVAVIIVILPVFDLIFAENNSCNCSTSSNVDLSSFQWNSSTVATAMMDQDQADHLSEHLSRFDHWNSPAVATAMMDRGGNLSEYLSRFHHWNSPTVATAMTDQADNLSVHLSRFHHCNASMVTTAAIDQDDNPAETSTITLKPQFRSRNRTCRHILRHWKDECTTTCYTRRLSTCVIIINYSWRPWRVNRILNGSQDSNPYVTYPEPPCAVIKECPDNSTRSYPSPPQKYQPFAPPKPEFYPRVLPPCRITAPYYLPTRPLVIAKPRNRPMYAVYCNCTTTKGMGMVPLYATTMCYHPTTICPYTPYGQAQIGPIPSKSPMHLKTPNRLPPPDDYKWPTEPFRPSKQYPSGEDSEMNHHKRHLSILRSLNNVPSFLSSFNLSTGDLNLMNSSNYGQRY